MTANWFRKFEAKHISLLPDWRTPDWRPDLHAFRLGCPPSAALRIKSSLDSDRLIIESQLTKKSTSHRDERVAQDMLLSIYSTSEELKESKKAKSPSRKPSSTIQSALQVRLPKTIRNHVLFSLPFHLPVSQCASDRLHQQSLPAGCTERMFFQMRIVSNLLIRALPDAHAAVNAKVITTLCLLYIKNIN